MVVVLILNRGYMRAKVEVVLLVHFLLRASAVYTRGFSLRVCSSLEADMNNKGCICTTD